MTGKGKSRWADSEEDAAREAAAKKQKEIKKRLKKEREAAAAAAAQGVRNQEQKLDAQTEGPHPQRDNGAEDDAYAADGQRPTKRRRLTPEPRSTAQKDTNPTDSAKLLRFQGGGFGKSRSVENYDKLNDIEEGAYGWVARAKEIATGKVVALKRLKIETNDRNGIPVTGLREIQILKDCEHKNIVRLQEVVVGDDTTKIEKFVSCFLLSESSRLSD